MVRVLAQEVVEGGFRSAVVALDQIAVGGRVQRLGVGIGVLAAAAGLQPATRGRGARIAGRLDQAADLILLGGRAPRVGGHGDRSEAGLVRQRTAFDRRAGAARTTRQGRLVGGDRRGGRQRAAAATQRTHLVLQLLELGSKRADLRLQAVEAAGIGGIQRRSGARIGAGARGAGGADPLGQRFEGADHHLHVDQLLLELLDALAQACVGAWRCAFLGGRQRGLAGGRRLHARAGILWLLLGAGGHRSHRGRK
jgi:hypothetical protein